MGLAYVRMSLTGLNRAVASHSLLIYDGYYRPAVMYGTKLPVRLNELILYEKDDYKGVVSVVLWF